MVNETLLNILPTLYSCIAIVSVAGYLPQIIALMRSKDTSPSLSITTWIIWSQTWLISLLYGIAYLNDWKFVLLASVNLTGHAIVIALTTYNRYFRFAESKQKVFFMQTIGLLGGSFNPAHNGHRHISLLAMKTLGLDHIWWLVSPHNPLKAKDSLADYNERLTKAQRVSNHPHIEIRNDEARFNTNYTIDTLHHLLAEYPRVQFVWLMGSDNLIHFHKWQNWKEIAQIAPIAVIDRNHNIHQAIRSVSGRWLKPYRVVNARELLHGTRQTLPRWSYITGKKHPLSATYLREKLGNNAF